MTTTAVDAERIAGSPDIQGSVELGSVTGGEETSPLWTSEVGTAEFRQALDQSLQVSGLLATSPETADYRLEANLIEVDQPLAGFDMDVVSTVAYTAYDKKTDAVFFEKTVKARFTATFSSSALGVKRLQLANEGSIRENIRQFLRAFISYWHENRPPGTPAESVSISLLVQ